MWLIKAALRLARDLLFWLLVFLAVILIYSEAFASKGCMTMAEARKAFPGKHLYWHGKNHCWDATSGRRKTEKTQHESPQKHTFVEKPAPEPTVIFATENEYNYLDHKLDEEEPVPVWMVVPNLINRFVFIPWDERIAPLIKR